MPLVRKPGLVPSKAPADASGLLQALRSADASTRWSAAREAAAFKGGENALVEALAAESDARVRGAMLTSLARIGTAASTGPLLTMLLSEKAAMRTAALDALRLSPILLEVTTQLMEDQEADVRLLSCDLARALPDKAANSVLGNLLENEAQPNVCAAAVEVLAELGEFEALPGLAACAKRFPTNEFLLFAIKTVVDRIQATAASTRG